jgi:opacity protein-like surface antigen
MIRQLAGLSSALALLSATADAEPDYARRGPYLGAAGIRALHLFKDVEPATFDYGYGFNARLGYRVARNFSAELQGEWADGFDAEQGNEFDLWALTLNAKLHLLRARIQPFALVGVGALHGEGKGPELERRSNDGGALEEDVFAFRLGGGIDFYASEQVVVAMEFGTLFPSSELNDFRILSLGLGMQYRF